MTDRTPPGIPVAKTGGRRGFGCLIVFAVILVAFVGCTVAISINGGNRDSSNNKYEAIAQCESRVEKLLKSPSTAEFDTDATGSTTWTVTGTVDSQNGFGATVRSSFQCTVVMNGDQTATTTVDYLE